MNISKEEIGELEVCAPDPLTVSKHKYMLQKGIEGEKQVAYHLNKANLGMYVLRDVNFSCDDMNAQVDFVVVTSHHCYFI